jgi:DNA-binding NtrC family response regulator
MRGRVLIVEDDRDLCEVLEARLARRGYDITSSDDADAALERIRTESYDVIVTDLMLGAINGLELCSRIVANRPDVPVIVMTAFGSMETAIAAIRTGAYDFLVKPVDADTLELALARAVQHRTLRAELSRLRTLVGRPEPETLIGESASMRSLRELVTKVAASEIPVLIQGETGTGKELVARAIHAQSRRRDGPFVAVNCAAIPAALLESELFGHVRGAFTDARQDRSGLCLKADGGTLLLDEIGDLPLELQPKLLRMLVERAVRPVGSDRELPFDARVIAATHRDLRTEVEEGRMREDLFFRLEVLTVEVPPLRARGSDSLLLAQRFIERAARNSGRSVVGLTPAAAERILVYSWPGNVRELENAMERSVALASFDRIVVEDLPQRIREYRRSDVLVASQDPTELVALEEVERRYILRVLESVGGNKTLAARILGLDRRTLYRKLERWSGSGVA